MSTQSILSSGFNRCKCDQIVLRMYAPLHTYVAALGAHTKTHLHNVLCTFIRISDLLGPPYMHITHM